jgi:TP901 family phage tail tape measure protein
MARGGSDSKTGRYTRLGLGAEFTFDDSRARAPMKRAETSLKGINKQLGGSRRSARDFGASMLSGANAAAPLIGMIAHGAQVAMAFESQMSAVNAVLGASQEDMGRLELKAKQLGASTKFTAKEAAEGMELLAMAGFSTNQIVGAIDGTLALAAAGGLKLADAASITSNVIKGMGLEAEQAGHVADVLAKGAAQANTGVADLGVAFKYAGAQAKNMGIGVEETTYLLGAMADAGHRGSSGGTALQNMLSKLVKPTEVGAATFKKLNVAMSEIGADGKKHMRPISDIVREINKGLSTIDDPVERAKLQEQIFGKIGSRGYGAMVSRLENEEKMTPDERSKRGVQSFMTGDENVEGAAKRMAEARLKGVAGALTILASASEGLILEMFNKTLTAPMEDVIKDVTDAVSGVVQVMQGLSQGVSEEDLEAKFGPLIAGIGIGLRDAVVAIGDAFAWIKEQVKSVVSWIQDSFGAGSTATIVKWTGLILAGVAAVSGIAVGLASLFLVIAGSITMVGSLASFIVAVFSPVALVIAVIYGLYRVLANENETFLETAGRLWQILKVAAIDFYESAIEPFIRGIVSAYTMFLPQLEGSFLATFTSFKDLILEIWGIFTGFFTQSSSDWKLYGETVMGVAMLIVEGGLDMIRAVLDMILFSVREVKEAIKSIASGEVLGGLKRVAMALFDLVLEPLKTILRTSINFADALGVEIPDAIRGFAFDSVGVALEKQAMAEYDDLDEGGSRFASSGGYAPEIQGAVADQIGESADASARKTAEATAKAFKEVEAGKEGCETVVNSNLHLDGKKVAKNQARVANEMDERAGFKSQPYQRGLMMDHGYTGSGAR